MVFPGDDRGLRFRVLGLLYFGAYPGSVLLIGDEARWRNDVNTSLVEQSIEKDLLIMTCADKPALLRQLFNLGCRYSGQDLSYTRNHGPTAECQYHRDPGQLSRSSRQRRVDPWLVEEFARLHHRRHVSSPKLAVLNMALMSASSGCTKAEAQANRSHRGRVVESTVGAYLQNTATVDRRLHYWRDGTNEVDFVRERGARRTAVEVNSGAVPGEHRGLKAFQNCFGECRQLLIGDGGIPLAEFLSYPAEHWL